MKAKDIYVGGKYRAKVGGNLTTVRVDAIRKTRKFSGTDYGGHSKYRDAVVYDVTNLTTGRHTVFHSAAKFRGEADVATVNRRQGREQARIPIVDPDDTYDESTNPSNGWWSPK
jgi:hypothetical protein